MTDATTGAAATGDTGATTQQATQQQTTQQAAPQSFDWNSAGLDAETLGWVQNKKYATVGDALSAHRGLEKHFGVPAEQLVRLPTTDDPASWRPIYERLGAGKTVDEYKLPVPEGDNGDFAKTAAGWFHEAGVPVKQAQKLAEKWNEHMAAQTQQQSAAYQQKVEADDVALKGEWGKGYDANIGLARRAAQTLGLGPEQIDSLETALGFGGLMRFMHSIGSRLGTDDAFVGGDRAGGSAFSGSPQQARSRIEQLKADPEWVKRYVAGGASERAEMTRLNQILTGGA